MSRRGCELVRLQVDEVVDWWVDEIVSSWVGKVVNWWGCEWVGLRIGEAVRWWDGELMYSGVIGLSWVYKSVSPSVLHFVYERRLYLVSAQETHLNCLNPCCNGWCTRTWTQWTISQLRVSLNPCCNGWCTRTQGVLLSYQWNVSLNPCCNGWCTRIVRSKLQDRVNQIAS